MQAETKEDPIIKAVRARLEKTRRAERCGVLRGEINRLEAERQQLIAASPVKQEFINFWTESLESEKKAFLHALRTIDTRGGVPPRLKFGTPGAIAYLLGDMWREVFPKLADELGCGDGISQSERFLRLNRIDEELMKRHGELSDLGGV